MELTYRDGLIPAIIQEQVSGNVLMLGYMNREAYARTLETGEVTFFSRSRGKLWTKGETSGHKLRVRDILIDCDQDALLLQVELAGPGVCHLGYRSCFFRKITTGGAEPVCEREFDPGQVYGKTQPGTP